GGHLEVALLAPQRRFQVQQTPLSERSVAGCGARPPEPPSGAEGLLGGGEVPAYPAGIGDEGPGVALEARPPSVISRHQLGCGEGKTRQLERLAGVISRPAHALGAQPFDHCPLLKLAPAGDPLPPLRRRLTPQQLPEAGGAAPPPPPP